ncbi:MAG: LysR family transcriptional regulator [Coriobacteriia bacterium]|nr:LysR family transcriptional regulator [Coriobacteriia bacterium]
MDSKQLQYFCDVVRLGSFTQAAEKAFLSQSAISQQVKALEAQLGVQLLTRKGRHFEPTPAGSLLARKGQTVLAALADLEAEVIDAANGKPRTLVVGYLNRYVGWEVAGAVAAFARRHPGCEVITEAGTHDQLYHGILEGRIHLAFNDVRRALSPEWENRYLMTGYRYAEVSEASTVAWSSEVTCQQLAGAPCILVCQPDQRPAEIAWWRDVLNFPGEFLFANSADEGRMMVASNRGWMPVESQHEEARTGSVIRRIPLVDDEGHSASKYYAFWPKDRTNPLIEEFAGILEEMFAE